MNAVDALVSGDSSALLAACPGGNSAALRVPCPMHPCAARWDVEALLRREPRVTSSLLLGVKRATEVANAAEALQRAQEEAAREAAKSIEQRTLDAARNQIVTEILNEACPRCKQARCARVQCAVLDMVCVCADVASCVCVLGAGVL